MAERNENKKLLPLSLGALGVVYGDIGTSPLYALQQTLPAVAITTDNILGVLSLVFWSLILVISTAYISLFLQADNEGEGGILALVSLLKRQGKKFPHLVFLMGILGAGLLLGDGIITPAISVISAVEGLRIISPAFSHLILPISFVILLVLFLCQRFGTAKIGFSFGPVILCWFITIGILGGIAIAHNPSVLKAVNPYYAFQFFRNNGWFGFILLSGVFLVITGAEAMYADLGHFGRNAIRLSWFTIVLPALLLNYFGQGAYLMQEHSAISHLFYSLAPGWFSFIFLILATLATIIASQAVISASFSLAKQAILLNVCPRLSIIHTSKGEKGQVYVPQINFILGVGTLFLVIVFQTSGALAAAYGMAVNLVMIIVTLLIMFVARLYWRWSIAKVLTVFSLFIGIDLIFFIANLHKTFQGAWIPLAVAFMSGIIMITWDKGMKFLRSTYAGKLSFPEILKQIEKSKLSCVVDITAVFIADPYDQSGSGFLHYLKLNRIMPKQILIVSAIAENYPYVTQKKRYELLKLEEGMYRLNLHYGFMQSINIPRSLAFAEKIKIFPFTWDLEESAFLVEIINISITRRKYPRLFYWQRKLFAILLRNSAFDIEFYHLPYNRTVAIGTYLEM